MRTKRRRPDKPDPIEDERQGLPSASGFDADFRCPGRREICKRLPKEESSAAAASGQRIHQALQKADYSELADSEQRTASRIAYAESEIVHEYGFEGAKITFEERIWDFDAELNRLWSGRVDRYDWQPKTRRLLVLDNKTGWTVPPPIHENWQVRSEAALLAEERGAVEVVAGLIHPAHPESLWEAKVYSAEELRHLLDIVRANVHSISKPKQRRIPGPIQCQWCPAQAICPEKLAQDAKLDQAIADHIKDEGFTAIIRQSKVERGANVQALKARLRSINTLLEFYTELVVKDPDSVAGWRLKQKLNRYVNNEVKAMELTRSEFGSDALYAALTFSPHSLEEHLAKDMTLKEAKAAVVRVLKPLIRYKKSKYFLEEARTL